MTKESTCNVGDAGDMGSVPGSGRSLGGGHGNALQYSCLENPMDRGAWRATVHGVAKSQTQQRSVVGYSPWDCKESDTTEVTQPTRTCTIRGASNK